MRIPAILAAACLLLASCKKEGCTDASAYNFNPEAELEDGTCQYSGCTDQLASNYDEGAAVNDGSCEYGGCMDPGALNYDDTATVDDGSCDYLGCTDAEAWNFDATATIDDGSCELPTLDGYTYKAVQIGDQVWFAENLRTTVYANGDQIPAGLTDGEWFSTSDGATTVYGEGSSSCESFSPDIDACDEGQSLAAYGRLYNWYAVDDARGLCPAGWHVPTRQEWDELKDYITSQGFPLSSAGMALKSNSGWYNNGNGTDDFGFSALPGGSRDYSNGASPWDGDFIYAGYYGNWWSASPHGGDAWHIRLSRSSGHWGGWHAFLQRNGFSVRCLRDAE